MNLCDGWNWFIFKLEPMPKYGLSALNTRCVRKQLAKTKDGCRLGHNTWAIHLISRAPTVQYLNIGITWIRVHKLIH